MVMDLSKFARGKTYDPRECDPVVYRWWEEQGFFTPEKQRELGLVEEGGPRFCLTLPPPNITGSLHLGHAITIAIEDMMVRYARMCQKETLFLPGTDHAGIATQNVVERELLKQGIRRKDLGREKFVEKVWEWKHKYHSRITEQSKRMGMSCDWNRERFTLDENLSRAVRTAFHHLYDKGLIYRGEYMINWCPGRCESAISDLEAEPEEVRTSLWYVKYPLVSKNWDGPTAEWGSGTWAEGATEFIEVATTRPETLLGDTAVATGRSHPEFGKLIGRTAVLPVNGRRIPIIADPYVDPEFGTGAVKITPAHDFNDFEVGQRHSLPRVDIFTEKAAVVDDPEVAGKYAGMDRFECREKIVEDLKKEGLLVKIEPYTHHVGHCQRCHTIVEPRVSTQWFVRTRGLANAAVEKVRGGLTRMIPEREEERFFRWMDNIRDWCISRQLWWGHRIPVWYCPDGHQTCAIEDPDKCGTCGSTELVQDEDVLDTWFSSGLWPFSTLGWPEVDNPDFARFYPTDVRETGYDILFFWVAREMMLGVELTGETPYSTVYFHGIIRNEQGKKISKSMENVDQYDPLRIISKYGADVLRYTFISHVVPGMDMNLDPRHLNANKKFVNKIWQAAKYVTSHAEGVSPLVTLEEVPDDQLHHSDRWILARLQRLVGDVTAALENHDYLVAARKLKRFYWGEFCDWYVEITKIRLYGDDEEEKVPARATLLHVLETYLRLLHPIMPHLTEILWQGLPQEVRNGPALIVARWPTVDEKYADEEVEREYAVVQEIIHEVRRVRTELHVPPGKRVPLVVDCGAHKDWIERSREEIVALAKIDPERLSVGSNMTPPEGAARFIAQDLAGFLPLSGIVDLVAERESLKKKLTGLERRISASEKKLAGPFSEKADPQVVKRERKKLAELKREREQLAELLESLRSSS
ncbi:MAG: valine--tRNA ligase [Promethearchaeota archaeon]